MPVGGMVKLNHKNGPRSTPRTPFGIRLSGAIKIPLALIMMKAHGEWLG